jgi:Flp pilus assembly protein TadD
MVAWAIDVLLLMTLLGAQTIEQLQQAVRLNSSDAEAHGRLGIARRKNGATARGVSSLTRAIELRPGPPLKVLLAMTHIDLGQCASAVPLLRESLAAEEKNLIKVAVLSV